MGKVLIDLGEANVHMMQLGAGNPLRLTRENRPSERGYSIGARLGVVWLTTSPCSRVREERLRGGAGRDDRGVVRVDRVGHIGSLVEQK